MVPAHLSQLSWTNLKRCECDSAAPPLAHVPCCFVLQPFQGLFTSKCVSASNDRDVLPPVSLPPASSQLLIRAYLEPSLCSTTKLLHLPACLRDPAHSKRWWLTSLLWQTLNSLCFRFQIWIIFDYSHISFLMIGKNLSLIDFVHCGRNKNKRNTRRFYYSLYFSLKTKNSQSN